MTEQKGNLERAAEIFERASQLQGEARERYLEGACGGDASLRTDIDSMLEAHAEQGEFLASPTRDDREANGQATETRGYKRTGEGPGTVIGRYKLLQRIGEGGFGTVYMAEQQEPVRRKVALKIIKLGMDTKQVIARFEAERQALAMMDHPHIAKVFDAGATETGRPYFVMELVKGIPITKYCDQENLSTKERLDLFMPVCNAIQHAHQKGIIHRDIKPSNVMVTLHDGKPVPKVIDFGIAKATDHRLTEKTLFTEYRQLVGTPAYMSPEQAEMSGLDVDTRTDIYSLGVLLYELLTGTTPFDVEKLRRAAYGEIQRIIREEEPPRPSTRLITLASEPRPSGSGSSSVADIAKHRRTDPSTLSKLVRGDLDWIVMKALEKDRTRRYETAKELAKDVEHHLAYQPILAGPPAAVYKIRKFIKRNRVAVTAGSLVAAAIVLGLIISTIGFVQARRQRDRAIVAEQQQSRERQRAETAHVAEAEQRKIAESERDRAREAEQAARSAEQQARRQAYLANIRAAGAALATNEIEAVRGGLDAAPEELRNWEWRYLRAQTDNSLVVLRGHEGAVSQATFSPDGTRLASASDDRTARVWDVSTGKELAILKGHEDEIWSVMFSPDGTRLASCSPDKTVRLWKVSTGKELAVLTGHEGWVRSVAFSPDGTRLASASDDNTVRLWDVLGRQQVAVLKGHDEEVASVAFTPDGTRLVSGSRDMTVRLWSVAAGEELAVLRGHRDLVGSVTFSPDGTRLASASDDTTVRIWNSVSFRVRCPERQAVLAARPQAERMVGDLWHQSIDAKSIAERLREDTSLAEPQRRAALNLLLTRSSQLQERVNGLYARLVFTDDVLAALEADGSLTPGARYKAVRIARRKGDKPLRLNHDSWNIVCLGGRDPGAYSIGLSAAEVAVAEEPENVVFLNTLGVAQYRNGRYEEAFATLSRCDEQRRQRGAKAVPHDVAFLAMTLAKRERTGEARAMLERLNDIMSDPEKDWRDNKIMKALFEEARKLINGDQVQADSPDDAQAEVRDVLSAADIGGGDGLAAESRSAESDGSDVREEAVDGQGGAGDGPGIRALARGIGETAAHHR